MKRITLLVSMVALILCTFTGCIVIPLYHHFDIDATTVSSIEIYDLCETDSSYGGEFLETDSPVYEIPKEYTAKFLNEFSKILKVMVVPLPGIVATRFLSNKTDCVPLLLRIAP